MNWKDAVAAVFCLGGLNPLCVAGCASSGISELRRSEDGSFEVTAESQESNSEALELARIKAAKTCDDEFDGKNFTLDTYSEKVSYILEPKYKETCRPHRYRSGTICRDRQIGYLVNGWRAYVRFKCL